MVLKYAPHLSFLALKRSPLLMCRLEKQRTEGQWRRVRVDMLERVERREEKIEHYSTAGQCYE